MFSGGERERERERAPCLALVLAAVAAAAGSRASEVRKEGKAKEEIGLAGKKATAKGGAKEGKSDSKWENSESYIRNV